MTTLEELILKDLGEMVEHISYNYNDMDLKEINKHYQETMYLNSNCNMRVVNDSIYILEGESIVASIVTGNLTKDLQELIEGVLDSMGYSKVDRAEFIKNHIEIPNKLGKDDGEKSINVSIEYDYYVEN